MIVITGAAGFIGSALAWELGRRGHDDLLLVDHLGTTEKWRNLVGLKFDDYMERERFLSLVENNHPSLKNITAIVHLGACSATTETNSSYLIENNTRYTQVLARWSVEHKVKFIYASSAATYGDGEQGYKDDHASIHQLRPLNSYALSKQLVDLWALKHGLLNTIIGIKFFNVYGPNEYHKGNMRSMVHKACGQIRDTGKVQLFRSHKEGYTDGGQLRDFIYIKDAIAMTAHFLENPIAGGLYNVGTGKAHTWVDLMNALFKALKKEPHIEFIPMPETLRDKYQYFTEADMTKTIATGYQKTLFTLEDAVADYAKYILSGEQTLAWETST